jgi:hypothetical protein
VTGSAKVSGSAFAIRLQSELTTEKQSGTGYPSEIEMRTVKTIVTQTEIACDSGFETG